MSQQTPRPPTSGTPGSSLPSFQSILNPLPDPAAAAAAASAAEAARGQGRGERPQPGALPTQQLPPIRQELPTNSSPLAQFSPRERFNTSYAEYSGGPPRPGELGAGPPPPPLSFGRSLPPPGANPYNPEPVDPASQSQPFQPELAPNFAYVTYGRGAVLAEVHAASRQADEKRKRNAGASARFRQRRKEKENQSTKEIDDLRHQIQDLAEEAEFYRHERDILLPLVYTHPDRDQHLPRPLSPRRRRESRPSDAGPSATSPPYSASRTAYLRSPEYEERGDRSSAERHTRRRLTTQDYGASVLGAPPAGAGGYGYAAPQSQPQQYAPREEIGRSVGYDARLPPPPGALPPPAGAAPPGQPLPQQRLYQPPDPYRRDWEPPPPPPPAPPDQRSGR